MAGNLLLAQKAGGKVNCDFIQGIHKMTWPQDTSYVLINVMYSLLIFYIFR
jgi:hypothetical protein